ncbi:Anoctamin-7, partial [Rhizophlyctis rosea]
MDYATSRNSEYSPTEDVDVQLLLAATRYAETGETGPRGVHLNHRTEERGRLLSREVKLKIDIPQAMHEESTDFTESSADEVESVASPTTTFIKPSKRVSDASSRPSILKQRPEGPYSKIPPTPTYIIRPASASSIATSMRPNTNPSSSPYLGQKSTLRASTQLPHATVPPPPPAPPFQLPPQRWPSSDRPRPRSRSTSRERIRTSVSQFRKALSSKDKLAGLPNMDMDALDIANHCSEAVSRIMREVQGSGYEDVVARRVGNRVVLMMYKEDVELFEAIAEWKAKHPTVKMETALRKFVQYSHADALVHILYSDPTSHWDSVLKFHSTVTTLSTIFLPQALGVDVDAAQKRGNFFTKLLMENVFIELEAGDAEGLMYAKVVASFEALCCEAERAGVKMPLKLPHDTPNSKLSPRTCIRRLSDYMFTTASIPHEKVSDMLWKGSLHCFRGGDAAESSVMDVVRHFFGTARRIEMVYSIMSHITLPTTPPHLLPTTIRDLLSQDVFTDWFALHDGSFHTDDVDPPTPAEDQGYDLDDPFKPPKKGKRNLRAEVYRKWCKSWNVIGRFTGRRDPLGGVRSYFGEKVAFWFAYLGFFTAWLLPLTAIGLGVFIYGMVKMIKGRTQLGLGSGWAKWGVIFDNEATPGFALIVCV